jgi:hypothetical protein
MSKVRGGSKASVEGASAIRGSRGMPPPQELFLFSTL